MATIDSVSSDSSTIRIAFSQIAPEWKKPLENIARIDDWIQDIRCNSIDILMLPEMAFTGYTFTSIEDISPFLESPYSGLTTTWCIKSAKRIGAWVVAGFPCKDDSDGKLYNAMCVINRQGEIINIYYKHFLFITDEAWASEGPSFRCLDIPEFGKIGLGICMDVNPYRFESPFDLCEFGNFHLTKGTQLLLCVMSWLRNDTYNVTEDITSEETQQILSYWAYRFRPLHGTGCLIAICNRVGIEEVNQFIGHSCILQMPGGPQQRDMEINHVGANEGLYIIEAPYEKKI